MLLPHETEYDLMFEAHEADLEPSINYLDYLAQEAL